MKNIERVLFEAMEIELNGTELYKTASQKTDDKQAKEVFDFLSKEESKHFKALKDLYDALKQGKDFVIDLTHEKSLNRTIFSDEFKKNLIGKNYEFSAISTGLLLEENSIEFYRKQKENASDPKIQSFFAELEKWETEHYSMLLREYNDIKQEYWEANKFAPF